MPSPVVYQSLLQVVFLMVAASLLLWPMEHQVLPWELAFY